MIMNFSDINLNDRPILILKRADDTPIGVLGNATNVEFEPKYNEVSVLTFTLPAVVDGVDTPFYDEVTGQKIVELKGIGQFLITDPEDSGDKVSRHIRVTANSLEREFTRKKITLPESTYKFFDETNTDGTILGMIMELMPNWHIGSVSSSLYNKYRTYSVSNENLYNFIKGSVQKAYNCIFDFNTLTREVSVRDADNEPSQKQVFISRDNLAKDISVKENTDDLVTRLDVNGADGVDIREVNPTGENTIVNLSYFMNTDNFSQELVDKYNAWQELIASNKLPFYNYAIQYSNIITEKLAENAKLVDLRGEYTSIENVQAAIIQGIAQNIREQSDLDDVNVELAEKKAEIDAKEAEIAEIEAERVSIMGNMQTIRDACAYANYFTLDERKILDSYIIDNEISESTFVASEVTSYTDGAGNKLSGMTVSVTGSEVTTATSAAGATIYSLVGGSLTAGDIMSGTVIRSIFEQRPDGKAVISIYLGSGTYNGVEFPSACVSVSGAGTVSGDDTSASCEVEDAYMYFSLNASEYEKKTVSWELYEYGDTLLKKMCVPSYTFSVDSANFIALDQFTLFKNELELGQRVYIEVSEGHILKPVCTGAKVSWGDRSVLDLIFTDTFTANDGQSKLIEILDESISMGKTLNSGKFTYEAWTQSGASSELRNFMTSALDTAKNAILSSTEQAVSWDGAGLRLRKYTGDDRTGYEDEQIWMSNNSIMMTDDGWTTAKMAIGKFSDENLGDKWGIIAPMIVGTLLAGEELVIESEKQSGDTAVFRVDADGCRLYNSDFTIQKTNSDGTTTQILLNPDVAIAMGTFPVTNEDGEIDTDNAKFWVDPAGTMHLTGSIYSNDGYIGNWNITPDGLWSGDESDESSYVGLSSTGTYRIWAGAEDPEDAPFSVQEDGTIITTKGKISGWYIGTDYIGNESEKLTSTVGLASGSGDDIVSFWAGGAQGSAPFRVYANGNVDASDLDITGGSISIYDDSSAGDPVLMFNVTNNGKVTANDITINGGSITIKDNGAVKFQVTESGKVTINDGSISIKKNGMVMFSVSDEGYLTANSGKVGGWTIGSDYIGNDDSKAESTIGMAVGTGDNITFWAGGLPQAAPFRVTAGGRITATSGTVGGWYIDDNHIGSGDTKANSLIGLYNGDTNTTVIWAGNDGSDPSVANFRVLGSGAVYASNMNISGGSIVITRNGAKTFEVTNTGAVSASDISITGGQISISNGTEVVFSVSSAGYLNAKSGMIGGWHIGGDYLGNASTKAASTVGLSAGTGTDLVIWAGTNKFKVLGNGSVTASDIAIMGGSISIKNSSGNTNFEVTSEGLLTAHGATIDGSIKADALYIKNNNTYVEIDSGILSSAMSSDGTFAKKTQFLQENGHLMLEAITETSGGVTTRAGIKIDSNGKLILDATDLVSIGTTANGIYITPTSISIDATKGTFSLNSTYTTITDSGALTTTSGKIGGWTIGSVRLNSGTGRGYVALDSDTTLIDPESSWNASTNDWVQPYAIWCGRSNPANAPFRVRRDGTIYINALMVWDGSKYVEVDFSRDFSSAVSLSSGGSWSGNTFNATLSFFNGKISKGIGISATATMLGVSVTSSGESGRGGSGLASVMYSVNGVGKTIEGATVEVDSSVAYKDGWQMAGYAVSYTSGATSVTVPAKNLGADKTTTLDISDTFDAGVAAGEGKFSSAGSRTWGYTTDSGQHWTAYGRVGLTLYTKS